MDHIAHKLFIGGIILAVIFSAIPKAYTWGLVILVIVGLLVGLFNIRVKENHQFLLAAVAMLLIGNGGLDYLPYVGQFLSLFVLNLSTLVAPAALVVAVKTIVSLAKKA
ncbi:hypothetical protein HY065_03515 [Candidatus Berkelbacteria bacterium]|nr:hypothetical protein [Candidatus Berkelbacteria bacterium]